MRKFLSVILALAPFAFAAAQDYAVELKTDKKVITIDSLGLPDNTPLLEVLRMIPELVVREGNEFLDGYDVLLDSKSVAYNKNGVLGTLKLFEVESIEISTSATASQQKNGMAGALKIVSKAMPEGLSGSITTNANTLWEAYPNMNVNYRTEKLEMRGNLGLQFYSGGTADYFERETPLSSEVGNDKINEKLFQETARLHLKYNITKKDAIKVWVIESFDIGSRRTLVDKITSVEMPEMGEYIYQVRDVTDTAHAKASNLNLSAFTEYEHTFSGDMKLSLSADYIHDGNRIGTMNLNENEPEKPQTIRTEAKFTLPVKQKESRRLEFSAGGNTEYGINDKSNIESRTYYASPFLDMEYDSPKLKLNAGIRYQHFAFDYDKENNGVFSKGSNDFTFNVNTLWQLTEHQAVRFFVTKNIIRPTLEQMYPIVEWNKKLGEYVAGNKDLKPAPMHTINLEYITDWKVGEHSFVANLGINYDHAKGMGSPVRRFDDLTSTFFMTYANTGVDNILSSKANLLYKYGILSVSFAGNLYHNIRKDEEGINNIKSFNLALSPIFSFRNNWTLSGTFRYNNALTSKESRLGECIYSNMRITKTFGRWILSAIFSDIFGYASENYEYKDGGYYYTMYDQYPRCLELGVTYRIGR